MWLFRPLRLSNRTQIFFLILAISIASTSGKASNVEVDFFEAISIAIFNDSWIAGNHQQQVSLDAQSIYSETLPDPQISLSAVNLPIDSFELSQEPMSQIMLGVTQTFPRGDSRELQQQKFRLMSQIQPFARENRKGLVTKSVANLWLDVFQNQETIRLIQRNRNLFEQLAEIVQARYSSAIGRVRQQDLVRAQLELTRLDDRLTHLQRQVDESFQQLYKWIAPVYGEEDMLLKKLSDSDLKFSMSIRKVKNKIPNLQLIRTINPELEVSFEKLHLQFENHPTIKMNAYQQKSKQTEVELAKQNYKPQWRLNASYGHRNRDVNNLNRSDFITFGITFDAPIFTENRQDQQVRSAIAESMIVKTERWELLRQIMSMYLSQRKILDSLDIRLALYDKTLIPQTREQAEAALTAYTNDDGEFSDVMRARIDELNAEIDLLKTQIERQKTLINLNYLLAENANEIVANAIRGE